ELRKLLVLLLFITGIITEGNAQCVFPSFDSLVMYVQQKSTVLHTSAIKYDQAKKARLAAIWGITDLTGNVSLAVTNNTRLPVSVFPAEAFGGAPGTFREVQTGIKYTNNLAMNGELKIVNPQGWQNFGLAKMNLNFAETDSRINEKSFYENVAVTYYNILTLQHQLAANNLHVKTADTLLRIVSDKFEQGLVKLQDVNDARVNLLNMSETGRQLDYQLQQQYLSLKVLCDIPEQETVKLTEKVMPGQTPASAQPVFNPLADNSSIMTQKIALLSYRQSQYSFLPSVSLVASNSYQQFNNSDFSLFSSDVSWINSNYIGAKFTWQLPNATSITQTSKLRCEYLIAQQNAQHTALKNQTDYMQLAIDDHKERSQLENRAAVYQLRKDSYLRNLENYKAGIIGLDILLNSYNSLAGSEYDYMASCLSVMHIQTRIFINNSIR
ncbi:MAG: TolC family protein, partial [Bacteroidia bacterium]